MQMFQRRAVSASVSKLSEVKGQTCQGSVCSNAQHLGIRTANNISGTYDAYLRQDSANMYGCQVLHAGRRYREENSTNNLLGDHLGKPDAATSDCI
jgi:hypothetical protein